MKVQKTSISILCLFLGMPLASAVTYPIRCGDQSTQYQVSVNAGADRAEVTERLSPVRFGDLDCAPVADGGDVFLRCYSRNVADAGYSAVFEESASNDVRVRLSEMRIFGALPLETLNCREVTDSLVSRTFWLTGDQDRDSIEMAPGGAIEINIRTASGTGYQWELGTALAPHTAVLESGPVFLPGASMPGAVGVTRFRFRVVQHPGPAFTLTFQLRRPWETDPVKNFHVRFIALRDGGVSTGQ